jgi:GTP-binding protein
MNATNAPPNVTIVGRPNVGKSALFNRLVGRQIAIVHDQPGITRDRISALCARGEKPFTVWDTGGVGGAGESELIAQVQGAVETAVREGDLLLFVVDAKQGLSPIDQELARMLRRSRKPVLLVVNKIDHDKHEDLATDFASLGFENTISISAAHGRGISELFQTIDKTLPLLAGASEIKHEKSDASPARTKPLAIAIIGRPNAGKSSIINSVLRSKRAIVSALPGTTRDSVDISYDRDGQQFLFIDTAGMRARSKHSTSVEVFSVMRAERSIRRADLCVLIVDVTAGATVQDKKIAALIQKARKASIVVMNKFDLVKPKRGARATIDEIADLAREQLFFLDYAPVLVASALTGEHVDKLFRLIAKVQRAGQKRIGTGLLNRVLRQAVAANPPPMISGRRLKLLYAAQASGAQDRQLALAPPEFVLFVNDPKLLGETYRRFLEARIREVEPYPGLPILIRARPRDPSHRD